VQTVTKTDHAKILTWSIRDLIFCSSLAILSAVCNACYFKDTHSNFQISIFSWPKTIPSRYFMTVLLSILESNPVDREKQTALSYDFTRILPSTAYYIINSHEYSTAHFSSTVTTVVPYITSIRVQCTYS